MQVGELRKAGKSYLVGEVRVGRRAGVVLDMLSERPLGRQGFGDVLHAFGIREPSAW